MNDKNREANVTKLQGYLKNATITVHGIPQFYVEIEELLLSQEHIIWMQQREIDDLRKRLKQMENLDLQNEQILYLQNINMQLKTQIEFLKSQIQEKDQMIGQLTLKPISTPSAEIIQTQQHLVQQNLQLQNIIGDLQNQILSKDNVISQLKQQENSLDSLIGQIQMSINNKSKKVSKQEGNGALKELQKYPDALSELIERIMLQQERLEYLLDEKDKEIANLKSSPQLNKYQVHECDELVFENQQLEDLIIELQKKLVEKQDQNKAIEKEVQKLQLQFDGFNQQKQELLHNVDQTQNEIKMLADQCQLLQEQNAQLQSEQIILYEKIDLAQQSITELQQIKDKTVDTNNLLIKNKEISEENNSLQSEVQGLSLKYQDCQNQLQESIKQLKQTEQQLLDCQYQILMDQKTNQFNQDKHDDLVDHHIKLDDLNQELEIKLAEKSQQHNSLTQNVANLDQKMTILGKEIQNKNLNIIELQLETQSQDALLKETKENIENLKKEKSNLDSEQKDLEVQVAQIREIIENIDIDLHYLQNELQTKQQQLQDLNDKFNSISIQEQEELIKQKEKCLIEQQEIKKENQTLQQELEKLKLHQEDILTQLNELRNSNSKRQSELEEQQQISKEMEHFYHSITAQQEEMEYQIKEKNEQLEKLNDQFTKVDDEAKMMESVIQLKQKELQQLRQKKENYIKDLDLANQDLHLVKKQIGQKRKQQHKNQYDEEQFENDLEEEIQDKLVNLHQKKSTLQQDVQRMVEQSPDPEPVEQAEKIDTSAQVSQFNQQMIQDAIKDREKRITILEMTIQTLQQQNQEKSVNPFQQQQRSLFMDEDPLLLELQEKFMKESELLQDLQNKLKLTADRHYQLSIKLQEWAEKESKLAGELDSRIKSVEQLESELQVIFNKQTDKESEKVQILERIYHVETEINEIIENELNTKNRLKEKKDYIQVLYKNLIDMDQRLLQLRNRMALYSQEGRLLAEQVENLENEKENKQNALISIQEDLEQIEQDKKEKRALIQSIKKEIEESQEQKSMLELQFATVHSKNLQLKSQIGFEETLYQKLLSELEIMKKKDQIQYQNVFSEGCTQTEYDLDQFEGLLKVTQFFRSTQEDILILKQSCQQQLASIYDKENEEIQKALKGNQSFKRVIHLQQMLILCQENENNKLNELNSGRSSNLVFKSCEVSTQSSQYTLEQIDPLLNKTTVVEIQLNEYSLLVGEMKIARQWILDKSFDYNNPLYPLGVLYIIYKVSIYQVVNIALTGSKVLQLWQTLL